MGCFGNTIFGVPYFFFQFGKLQNKNFSTSLMQSKKARTFHKKTLKSQSKKISISYLYFLTIVTSTRRFLILPSSVSLSARGSDEPFPSTLIEE